RCRRPSRRRRRSTWTSWTGTPCPPESQQPACRRHTGTASRPLPSAPRRRHGSPPWDWPAARPQCRCCSPGRRCMPWWPRRWRRCPPWCPATSGRPPSERALPNPWQSAPGSDPPDGCGWPA
ncbi:HTH-type transcriptional regulator immR, partial [Dysosmobacter welbionis]